MSIRSVVQGIGHAVPDKVLTNADLEKLVDTNDEWITQRTGIKERRICRDDEAASDLATIAAKEALEKSGVDAKDLDMVILATVTGDYIFPSTSGIVQDAIGAKKAGAFDVQAACAGTIYALSVADAMLKVGHAKHILVVGVDTLSKFVNWEDRSTCVLFGDGAGAMVLSAEENTDRGIVKTVLLSDGSGAQHICLEVGGSRYPLARHYSEPHNHYIYMNGAETYRFAVKAIGDACCKVLEEAGLHPDDVDLFVPHQANLRIIESAAARIELPPEKVFVNIHKYGNTSAGSIPLGLYEAEKEGRLRRGDLVLTVGFGAGLVWGANLIRW